VADGVAVAEGVGVGVADAVGCPVGTGNCVLPGVGDAAGVGVDVGVSDGWLQQLEMAGSPNSNSPRAHKTA